MDGPATTPDTAVAGTSMADIAASAMMRRGAADLDDGKPAPDPESLAPLAETAEADPFAADVIEAMKDVVDPELGINVVDLGLVYGVNVHDGHEVTLDMTLTSAACPLTDVIEDQTPRPCRPRDEPHDQLGLDAAVGSGQDHRRRARAVAGTRLPGLTGPTSRLRDGHA